MEVYFYLISRFLIYKKLWEKDDDSDVEENEWRIIIFIGVLFSLLYIKNRIDFLFGYKLVICILFTILLYLESNKIREYSFVVIKKHNFTFLLVVGILMNIIQNIMYIMEISRYESGISCTISAIAVYTIFHTLTKNNKVDIEFWHRAEISILRLFIIFFLSSQHFHRYYAKKIHNDILLFLSAWKSTCVMNKQDNTYKRPISIYILQLSMKLYKLACKETN